MSVRTIQRSDDCKGCSFEEFEQILTSNDAKEALLASTASNWGVVRDDLDDIIAHVEKLQDLAHTKFRDINGIEAEEIGIIRLMRHHQEAREKALKKACSAGPEGVKVAQERLSVLEQQLREQEIVLKTAATEMKIAADAYEAAVQLRRDKTKSSKVKTRLNKEWLGIQQAKSRTEKVYGDALKCRDATASQLREQIVQVKSLLNVTQKFDADLLALKEKLLGNRIRRTEVDSAIDAISKEAEAYIEAFIRDKINPADIELQGKVRTGLMKLKRSCFED